MVGPDPAPRLLAVTGNPTLVIGLTFLPDGWEIESQPTAEGPLDADVVVLDLGSTTSGLSAARSLPPTACAVVLGDEEPDTLEDRVRFVRRPFTLDDLRREIEALLEGPSAASEGGEEEPRGDDGPTAAMTSTAPTDPDAEPDSDGTERTGRARWPDWITSIGAGGSADRATGSWEEGSEDPEDPAEEAVIDLNAEPPLDDAAASQAAASARGVEPGLPDELGAAAQPADPAVVLRSARTIDVGQDRPGERRPARWRARRPRRISSGDADFRSRLARVLTATGELEELVAAVPLLADLDALTRAVVREIAARTAADSVGYWRRAEDGWHLAAHLGLTPHEATWRVPPDQPLFMELEATGGALLIDPVDRLQAAVAGIGGAHTESFMAAAIAVGPGRYGIVAVGRNAALGEPDLDLLAELALDAAPGVAVAEQLIRLRGIVAQPPRPLAAASDGLVVEDVPTPDGALTTSQAR